MLRDRKGLWNLRLDSEGQASLGFLVPIYPMDAQDNAKPIAYVVGLKQVAKELFPPDGTAWRNVKIGGKPTGSGKARNFRKCDSVSFSPSPTFA